MLSKRYESTEVDRNTWLHVPSGTPRSTSSDTHQVVTTESELKWCIHLSKVSFYIEIKKETSTKMYTPF